MGETEGKGLIKTFNTSLCLFYTFAASVTNTPLPPRQDLHCGICSNVFTNPLMMPCLHSFCKKCLEQQLEEQGSSAGSIKCPTCDTVSILPSGGVASLPNNHWLAHQAEVSTYQQKIKNGDKISCDRCVVDTSGAAVTFCCSCCLFLCSLCEEDHKRWRETVSHELVSVGVRTDMDTKVGASCKSLMCAKHPKEYLKFYCDTCHCLVCRDCIAVEHSDHTRVYPENVAEREKESLSGTVNEAGDAITKLETAITSRESIKKPIETQKDVVKEKITEEFKKIYSSIQEREKALLDKCEKITNHKLTVLSMEIEEMQNLKESFTFSSLIAAESLSLTPAELLSTRKFIQEYLQTRLTAFARFDLESGESDDISVGFDKTAIDEAVSKMGCILGGCDPAQCTVEEGLAIPLATARKNMEIKVALRNSIGELVRENVPMVASLKTEKDGSVEQAAVRFVGDSHALLCVKPIKYGEHEFTIRVKNRHIARSPYKIWSRQYAAHKNFSSSLRQTFYVDGSATGVAVHHNGDVFASNYNCGYVQVFSCDGSEKLRIGSRGSGDGQLNGPFGLTIVDEVLYVVDSNNRRVQKFTLSGEYLGQFGSYGSGADQFHTPYGICTDGKGRVLVVDYSNNRLLVFNADGTFVSSLSCGFSYSRPEPYDVAVDNTGNIHVTLNSSNRVVVYSSDGKQITTYGSGNIRSPTGIAIDEEGYRYVSDNRSRISIFGPEGALVSDSIICPSNTRCMTLDSQGNVYVASYNTNCITKYNYTSY